MPLLGPSHRPPQTTGVRASSIRSERPGQRRVCAMPLDPRTPVIVGVSQINQHPDDPAEALEPLGLMREAIELAAVQDAGSAPLLKNLDAIGVITGAWRYSDPARLLAEQLGATTSRSILSYNGGNTPQSFVNDMARRIQAGELGSAAIVGAETIWSRRRQKALGVTKPHTEQADVEPDERFQSDIPMSTEFEMQRGMMMPINYYPLFESAIRAKNGETIDAHRTRVTELWSRFNDVAVDNPYGWNRQAMTAEEIRTPSKGNRMVGFPYTKAMNSNWDLDQAAAIIICSVEAATTAGISKDRWVFPLAGTDAHDTYAVSERRDLHSSPAIFEAGQALSAMSGTNLSQVDHIDLYSCFPSAVQVGARELGIDLDRQLTQTGGLTFAGGPLNNYVAHSIATMVGVLREDAGTTGLVTANGGYLTKHALGLYSTNAPDNGFKFQDVQPAVDMHKKTAVDETYAGPATIEAYTVMHNKDGAEKALAALQTPNGSRTWGSCSGAAAMEQLMTSEGVGVNVTLDAEGAFAL